MITLITEAATAAAAGKGHVVLTWEWKRGRLVAVCGACYQVLMYTAEGGLNPNTRCPKAKEG